MAELRQRCNLHRKAASTSSHHGHSHAAGEDETEALLSALKGSSDPGARITLIGLAVNILLVAAKGIAGWILASAALVADAGHSLGDLVGDFVVLCSWNLSRRPPSASYPNGYGKYESLGSLIVGVLLCLAGVGIGLHSIGHGHGHGHGAAAHGTADPNAAWFALGGILVKEWLYRITIRVAKQEKSNVLMANALHHRSDALSSTVALAAIALGVVGFTAADMLGGLAVSAMILYQGFNVGLDSIRELLDEDLAPHLTHDLREFVQSQTDHRLRDIRRTKSGMKNEVRIDLAVPRTTTIEDCSTLEADLVRKIREAFEDVTSVTLRFVSL